VADDDDLAGADLDRIAWDHPEREDFAAADHAMTEAAQVTSLLLADPTQEVGRVPHQQPHPFGSGHLAAPKIPPLRPAESSGQIG
jgi:hypothetical protein